MEPLPEAVKQFVHEARVCRIATARPNGEPHAIPVCPVFDGEATVYVDIGSKYASAEGVRASGKVAVLIDYYDDNWALLKGVLLRCNAEPAEGEEQERAWLADLRLAAVGHHTTAEMSLNRRRQSQIDTLSSLAAFSIRIFLLTSSENPSPSKSRSQRSGLMTG
ncbi:MAG: hypothetical protein E6I02_07975 [Chloroflexi bacterium]|nr:MAG: hypothetical protein E6I02_07975 [Chloroflexota bacterium]